MRSLLNRFLVFRRLASALLVSQLIACAAGGPPPATSAAFDARIQKAKALDSSGQHDAALDQANQALAMARADPGPLRRRLGNALQAVAQAQFGLGHTGEVIAALTEALPIVTANYGPVSQEAETVLDNLASASFAESQPELALKWLQQAIAIAEQKQDEGEVEHAYGKLAWIQIGLGDYVGARSSALRAIELAEKRAPTSDLPHYFRTMATAESDLGDWDDATKDAQIARSFDKALDGDASLTVASDDELLGDILVARGRGGDAMKLYDSARAVQESQLDPASRGYSWVAGTLQKMANIYSAAQDWQDAIDLDARALSIHKRLFGDDSLEAAIATVPLAQKYFDSGAMETAFHMLTPVGEIMHLHNVPRSVLRPAADLLGLILVKSNVPEFRARGRQLYEQLAEEDRRAGNLVAYGVTLQRLGLACTIVRDRDCAIGAFQKAVEDQGRLYPATSVAVTSAHSSLGAGYVTFGEYDKAVDEFGFAVDGWIRSGNQGDAVVHSDASVDGYLDALWHANRAAKAGGRTAAAEAFLAMQVNQETRAALALSQMVARTAAGGGPLADLVRQDQDLTSAVASLEKAFASALSRPESPGRTATLDAIRAQAATTERARDAVRADLATRYPRYHALTSPPVVTAEALQPSLRAGELMLAFNFSPLGGFVWALSHDHLEWAKVDLTDEQLAAEVHALRDGLDPGPATRDLVRGPAASGPPSFDRARAYRLYTTLFASLADSIRRADHLFVVPSGPLQGLPLGVLVTRDPAGAPRTFDSYRDTAWWIREKSLTVLPSVSSLLSVRGISEGPVAPHAFVGIGDPALSAQQIQNGLPLLPESVPELRAMAVAAGGTLADVHVQGEATEDAVKAMDLGDDRILAFATHGLTAREIPGLAEPALVLSAPRSGDHEDGYLTASEVAALRLHAEWVVLSACNGVASDGSPRQEALSGLARAFFYAGARAVLASNWSVYSEAAAELTTKTFDTLRRNPTARRADALRSAMLAVMNEPFHSDPAYWAPFSFIGDGDTAHGH